GGDVLLHIVRHGDAVVAVLVHSHCGIHRLQEAHRVDAREDEVTLVQGFRPLGRSADAHRREGWPTLVKKLLSSGSVLLLLTALSSFVRRAPSSMVPF